ncbi:MAG: hypothetical protein ACRDGD_12325 [Candidatus Limnocylindria bacterium]
MTVATRRGSRSQASEEAVAAARVVLGLTIGVGFMAAAMGAATGDPISLVVVPTLVLVASLAFVSRSDRAVMVAGMAGVAVWLVLLPQAHAEAMLAPLAMIVLCLAIALGPDRLLGWIGRDVRGRASVEAPPDDGWIEETRPDA